MLFKVFDSKEEISTSSDEEQYGFQTCIDMDSAGTQAMVLLVSIPI